MGEKLLRRNNKVNDELKPRWLINFEELLSLKVYTFREFVREVLNEDLEEPQYEIAEKVLVKNKDIWSWERNKNLFIWLFGKGAGKGTIAVSLELYAFYSLLLMPNPQKFFKMLESDEIAFVNVALSGEQSRTNIYDRVVKRLIKSKWFLDNYTIVYRGKALSRGKSGEIYISLKEIDVPFKRIKIYSENSKYEHWEGKNILFFVLDEFSGCKTQTELEWARGVFNSLITSNRELPFIGIVMSYMRLDPEFDATYNLVKRVWDGEIKNGEAFIRFTWELRPSKYEGKFFIYEDKDTGNKYLVPKLLETQFSIDEDSARRRYLCIAGRRSEAGIFMEKPEKIVECIMKGRGDAVSINYEVIKVMDRNLVRIKVKNVNLLPNRFYVIAIDKGEKLADTVLSIGHKEAININGSIVEKVVIDSTIVWRPEKDLNLSTDTENVSEVLFDILKYIPKNNVKIRIDHWQSSDLVNKCLKNGYRAEQKNASLKGYKIMKELIENNLFELPDTEVSLQGKLQLKYLRERGESKPKVSIGKQDIVDAWAEICEELVEMKMMSSIGRIFERRQQSVISPVIQKQMKDLENFFIHPFFVKNVGRGRVLPTINPFEIKKRFDA